MAAAVNAANVGVRAALVNTDSGIVLQFTSTTTGTANAFSISGLDNTAADRVAAQNAQIAVGDPAAGGYTVSPASTNTFTNAIPGVTFSVERGRHRRHRLGRQRRQRDQQQGAGTGQRGQRRAHRAVERHRQGCGAGGQRRAQLDHPAAADHGQPRRRRGNSFATSGIDLDLDRHADLRRERVRAAYTADPTGTQPAPRSPPRWNSTATGAVDPDHGTISPLINSATSQVDRPEQADLRLGHPAAPIQQTAAAEVHRDGGGACRSCSPKQTYLTSMFNSMQRLQVEQLARTVRADSPDANAEEMVTMPAADARARYLGRRGDHRHPGTADRAALRPALARHPARARQCRQHRTARRR